MKGTVMDHLKMPWEEVSNLLLMYQDVIKNTNDTKDPDIWQRIRDEWITKLNSEE
jgi:hypothetical protein